MTFAHMTGIVQGMPEYVGAAEDRTAVSAKVLMFYADDD